MSGGRYDLKCQKTDGNRPVDIISRVGELKKRIDRQIVVKKGKNGASTAHICV